ncbi:TPA: hypothetical protein ENS27_16630 [bacterium]|nr:hypothetical protein [bacterium]
MQKIIIIIGILIISSHSAFAYSDQWLDDNEIEQSDNIRNKQIAMGYSFSYDCPYGWCFIVLRQGIGFYIDAYTNARGHSIDENDYYASLSLEESYKWNVYIKSETHKLQYSIGITYPFMDWLYGYLSVGRCLEQDFHNFYDSYYDSLTYFDNGMYWVAGDRKQSMIGQSGLIFYKSKFFVKAGTSFKPFEYKIGLGVKIY